MKDRKQRIKKNLYKSAISVLLTVALVLEMIPFPDFVKVIDDSFERKTVHAVEDQVFEEITRIGELVTYSQVYSQYPENHYDDVISIVLTNDTDSAFEGFVSIGTERYPFAGTISIDPLSASTMNLDKAFFDYVYDYAKIESADPTKYLIIAPTTDVSTALFANHVVHDTSDGVIYEDDDDAESAPDQSKVKHYSTWTIGTADYQMVAKKHGSLIGEIAENAKVTINSVNSSTGNIDIENGNVGTICGKMNSNSQITVASISGSTVPEVKTGNGNAGGLVGEMCPGSILSISGAVADYVNPASQITASNYAGGLVGKNDQATLTCSAGFTNIIGSITGTAGAGGLYGYYKPIMPTNAPFSFDTDGYQIGASTSSRCIVSSPGGCGGFFGVLDNPGGTINISGKTNTIYAKGNGNNSVFGGIIGSYTASSLGDSLFVSGVNGNESTTPLSVNTARDGNVTSQSGIIGKIDGEAFVSISDVNVTANNVDDDCFGGAVGYADSAYVYVKNFTLSASSFKGGGIVGHTTNGVIHLAGNTNLTNASANTGSVNYGQIVGYRDNALVFADSSWNLTRNSSDVSADDIGSWGEVVRFKSSGFTIDSVLDTYYDPSAAAPVHYATIKGATIQNNIIQLSSKSTFATAALNMQLNSGVDGGVLKFSDLSTSTYSALKQNKVALTADVDLSHTGMTGLTRDNKDDTWTSGIGPEYAGSEFDGGSHTITLAIGSSYEGTDSSELGNSTGKGKIYCHRFNGLFGETTGAFTVKNVTVSGEVHTYDLAGSAHFYVGTIAGIASASFNASGVSVDENTSIVYGANGENDVLYVGGLVGKMSDPGSSSIGSATYSGSTDSTFSAEIYGNAGGGEIYVGGVVGYVGAGGNLSVNDIKISNSITNIAAREKQRIAGLFCSIENGTNSLSINGIEIDGLTLKGKMKTNGFMGGLFGYAWDGVTATFNNVKILKCTLDNDSTSGNMAGLVYAGSGYWRVNKIEIGSHTAAAGGNPEVNVNGITLKGTPSKSFGMLVNRTFSGEKAMYLELPSGFTYTIHNIVNDGAVSSSTVYDEIVAYSKVGDKPIEENGHSIISINTTGTTKYGTQNDGFVNMTSGDCNTYQNQVTLAGFNKYNANSRYYYNLDNYKANQGTGAQALFTYSVKKYAHSTIADYFNASGSTFSGNLDLDGYSYYPFDFSETIDICGAVKLHNKDIEDMEAASSGGSDAYARTTLDSTHTQHYLMHAGLFRNVSGTVNINGELTISGTVPVVDGYCGALICGTISGSAENDAEVISDNQGAKIKLSGIKVHNKNASYSPLLINSTGGNIVLDICNVSASDYTNNDEIATSLIGRVGTDTAEKVRVTFKNIKLDARETENTLASLNSVYGTNHSLFTRATLLESLSYATGSGSYGKYNYEYSEDWPTNRNVTYGKEISDDNSVNAGKEYYYYKNFGDPAYFTNPEKNSTSAGRISKYDFGGYRPYVAVWGTDIGSSSTKHQLDVNHSAATFGGCGTYNHPFTLAYEEGDPDKSGGLFTIAKIITGINFTDDTFTIDLPDDIYTPERWCNTKTSCSKYKFNGSDTFVCVTDQNKTYDLDSVRQYLAGAYYYLSTDIELSDTSYTGLGNSEDEFAIFRGVIFGDGKEIVNKTAAPLIYASNGCVVKNVKIIVQNTVSIDLSAINANQKFASTGGASAYGAVIGRVLGGDNIIDQVKVDVSGATVTYNYLSHAGGYVGVVVNGGVIFRNMDDTHVPAADKAGFGNTGNFAATDMGHLYCNPIIGRVINGYAVNESDAYRPFEDGTRSYGDGSKDYWQANGTIITKTKAELDADENLDATMKASSVGVTLKNNNKNYSITDINPDEENMLDVNSDNEISIPNSQAFFVMSLIVNSGMGSKTKLVLGYYGQNQVNRHADYQYVATNIDLTETTADAYEDYANSLADDDANRLSYVIENYTKAYTTNDYYAQYLGSNTYTLTLGSNNIMLPDGYKGIGNFYQHTDNLRLALSEFDGNSKTITQNTTHYCYESTSENYSPNYASDYSSNAPQYYSSAAGLGLFNCQTMPGEYHDAILSGNVKGDVYTTAGKQIVYKKSLADDVKNQAVGSLFGALSYLTTTSDKTTINDVILNNVDVRSAKHAGGLIGFIPLSSNYDTTKDNKVVSITNTKDSKSIKVHAGLNAGGLIGFYYMGNLSINFNSKQFDISEIESECTNRDTGTNDWDYACGGLIGVCRGNNAKGVTTNQISIKNVVIGKSSDTSVSTVKCEKNPNSGNPIYVGGVIGILNRAPLTMENCTFYHIDVTGKSFTGGLVGWAGTASGTTIKSTDIITNSTVNAKIQNTYGGDKGLTGGFIGNCKNDMQSFTIQNCSIQGYEISHDKTAGGVLGDWSSSSYNFIVKDFTISDCTIKAKTNTGGLAGTYNTKTLQGYNILAKNLSFSTPDGTGTATYCGYIVGNRGNNGTIQVVGFSRQGNIQVLKLIGNKNVTDTNAALYNTNGYVFFADFEGTALTNAKNTNLSGININGIAAVAGMGSSPYVTINPAITIDDNIGLMTSDGISLSAVNSILLDDSDKKYTVADRDYFMAGTEINTGYISSFQEEFKDIIPNKSYDFPMLVVNSSSTAEVVVNKYLRLLTNTGDDVDFSTKNNAINVKTEIGIVKIRKCTYNQNTGKFTISNTDNDSCLYMAGSGDDRTFAIRTSNGKELYDTTNENGQFTLIDVAFKDPSDKDKIAYHLYVPVIVKKLLEYTFDISSNSGTSYEKSIYEGDFGNVLVENLGTPITMEFRYTYLRTEDEWVQEQTQQATNYVKKLEFKTTAGAFPASTKMVLIDVARNGKAYYLDSLSVANAFVRVGNTDTYILDLQKFTDVNGNAFEPVPLSDLDAESMTLESGTRSYRCERYYLSIFTESVKNAALHYAVKSQALTMEGYPTKKVPCDCVGKSTYDNHEVTDLILGDFYTNNLTVQAKTVRESMDNTNDEIEMDLTAVIDLNPTTKDVVKRYLKNSKVHIYQTMLVSLNKYDYTGAKTGQGVRFADEAVRKSYTIRKIGKNGEETITISSDPIKKGNYIEFPNNDDISSNLYNDEVEIRLTAVLQYYVENSRNAEFDYKDETNADDHTGASVVGYSNISSKAEMAAYSNVSSQKEDPSKKYYLAKDVGATLKYNASYPADDHSEDDQLGVNPLEFTGNKEGIKSVGVYDVSRTGDTDDAEYVLCIIQLKQKVKNGESYSEPLPIADYLTDLTICNNSSSVVLCSSLGTDTYQFILKRDQLDDTVAKNVYTIPINFSVYTGDNGSFEDKTSEGNGLQYGNYQVILTAYLATSYTETNSHTLNTAETILKTQASDKMIYTNARLYTDLIK